MKISPRLVLSTALCSILSASAFAQTSLPGKVFVAQVTGDITYVVDGQVVTLVKGETIPVQGAHIETAQGASLVLVYSNGTSIYIDQNTILDINRFVQKPFPAGVDTTVLEPSTSNTLGRLTQGRVVISTNQLATGTSMIYETPDSQVRIRGKDVVIEVEKNITNVIMLRGDATVIGANAAPGDVGRVLHSGEMAIVTGSLTSTIAPAVVRVVQTNTNQQNGVAPLLAATQRAQSVVVFQTVTTDTGNGDTAQEIESKAVVSADPPVQLTVSPSTLRTGG